MRKGHVILESIKYMLKRYVANIFFIVSLSSCANFTVSRKSTSNILSTPAKKLNQSTNNIFKEYSYKNALGLSTSSIIKGNPLKSIKTSKIDNMDKIYLRQYSTKSLNL